MPIPHLRTLLSLLGTAGALTGLVLDKTPAHRLAAQRTAATESIHGQGPNAVATITGPPIPIAHGIVQVRITTSAGRITSIAATSLPHDNAISWARSAAAAAQLAGEVLRAQSARVDAVSGATYTSRAYLTSLQAAIDAAGTPAAG
jgi:hypothetical protein